MSAGSTAEVGAEAHLSVCVTRASAGARVCCGKCRPAREYTNYSLLQSW